MSDLYELPMMSGDEIIATTRDGVRMGTLYATRVARISNAQVDEIARGRLDPESIGLSWTPPASPKPALRAVARAAHWLARWLERRGW